MHSLQASSAAIISIDSLQASSVPLSLQWSQWRGLKETVVSRTAIQESVLPQEE